MFFNLLKKREPAPMGSKASNDEVRAHLKRLGDMGVMARHIIHYAYPPAGIDLSNRDQMIAELRAKGFDVSDAVQDGGLVLEHHGSVAGAQFDTVTTALAEWFETYDWDYDGWECAVAVEPAA